MDDVRVGMQPQSCNDISTPGECAAKVAIVEANVRVGFSEGSYVDLTAARV